MYSTTVLVTGGAGFIGSHIVINLVKNFPEYYVINLDKLDYVSNLENLSSLVGAPNYRFVKGDITDAKFIQALFIQEKIDYVIHCAAKTHVENSFFNSLEFTHDNVLGSHILINSAYMYGNLKLFLHVSTDEVYGGKSEDERSENSFRQPTNPYAASKAAAECLVMSYWESFKFPIIITRLNNVYGPFQYPEKVIPKFIGLLQQRKKCFIHGDGLQSRNFLYATDAVNGIILVMNRGKPGEIYNIGSRFEISMKELAVKLAMEILGVRREEALEDFIEYVKDRPFNDLRYLMNSNKVKELGWKPQVEWEDGIEKTILWYKTNINRWPCLEEILVPFTIAPGYLHEHPRYDRGQFQELE